MTFDEFLTNTAYPVFYRTYSRLTDKGRESWAEVCERTISGLAALGKLTQKEVELITRMQTQLKALPSGRWLWVGGTPWIEKPENFSGAYNCSSTNIVDWESFALLMDLAMMGCGTGAVIEPMYIEQLPTIRNYLEVEITGKIGQTFPEKRKTATEAYPRFIKETKKGLEVVGDALHEVEYVVRQKVGIYIIVGDSRQGWVNAYRALLETASYNWPISTDVQVTVDISNVRPMGEALKGFGGVANPIKLPQLFERVAAILNGAYGRQLTATECALIMGEAALTVVAGNIRRSASIMQGASEDMTFAYSKDNLWQQDAAGNWRIDPTRDALRMANHTRVYHHKPTLQECIAAVSKQYYSGEGAIQWAGEAVARANADIIPLESKADFLAFYSYNDAKFWIQKRYPQMTDEEIGERLSRYGLNPCVTADTWVHTEAGAQQVKDLVGKQIGVYVNGELFSTTSKGFWKTGDKPVFKLTTQEGYELRLTGNHKLLKVTAQTQKKQYSQWEETQNLKEGDCILLQNHRGIQPWEGSGTFDEGWLLGNLIGDGSISKTQWGYTAHLRYWLESQDEMATHAVSLLRTTVGFNSVSDCGCYNHDRNYRTISSAGLAKLAKTYGITANHKRPTAKVEQASYAFYCGFLRGFFDADGSVQGTHQNGVSIRLSQSNLETLKIVQRMLARLGIISAVYQERRPEGIRYLPDSQRQLAPYFCQANHELIIANDNIYYFQELVGFKRPHKAQRLAELLSGYKRKLNRERFAVKIQQVVPDGIEAVYDCTVPAVSQFDANGIAAHNCGEIIGSDFHCNLSEVHLNQLNPDNYKEQEDAFTVAALSVAALLHHEFKEPRYQKARGLDPIVGVSFTGLFDFFVKAFGVEWLQWWEAGRPQTPEGFAFKNQEQRYFSHWNQIVHQTVWDYCLRHNLKRPNRCTTCQPAGTKSLLTGASPGWHPPKAQRYTRRITFAKDDPVALACIDYGYSVVPAQSDKDEQGNLLNDPFDPRCTEWLVEIPVAVPWADLEGADQIDISRFSALAQFDFYMQVQQHYVTHNTSATIELREDEIEPLGTAIYEAIQQDRGYVSAALLARSESRQSYPRLPFEPIDKATYEDLSQQVLLRRVTPNFHDALSRHDSGEMAEAGPAGCDSDKCLFPTPSPE